MIVMRKGYCPKSHGHGIDDCEDCMFYMDDCDGDD